MQKRAGRNASSVRRRLADGIFSMWIQTEKIAKNAKPGQFISVYSKDGSKLLPRPISICEIDKENGSFVWFTVSREEDRNRRIFQMKAGDTISVIGPLGKWIPIEKAEGKQVFLMGGGIGVPPILELAKQMECEKKQIVVGYRDAMTYVPERRI